MGSTAAPHVQLPGPPQQTELAYLAALIDRSGTFCATRSQMVAIKLSAPPELRGWLTLRFGGWETPRGWALSRRSDLRYVTTGVLPFLVVKAAAGGAFLRLLEHLAERPSYHGTVEWRSERERLKAVVRSHLSQRARAVRSEPCPDASGAPLSPPRHG